MYIFEISMKRRIFYAPFDLFKEKKFSSLWELKKVKNERNRLKFRKTVFYKQILDFHCLPKFSAIHRIFEILSKSVVPNDHFPLDKA